MNLLSLEQAQKSYGEKVLLKQANFYLNEGEKVGIIGIKKKLRKLFFMLSMRM